MNETKLGAIESKFADMIWQNEPVSSADLVKMAEAELDWKKSTTYTVLRRLCDRGIFQNTGGRVTSVISREDFYAAQSERFVEETFSGSLPAFVAAFTKHQNISGEELDEVQRMIDRIRKGGN